MIFIKSVRGVVLSYDAERGVGRVQVGKRVRRFSCTVFRSRGRPLRLPEPRAKVDVLFNVHGQLVAVREV